MLLRNPVCASPVSKRNFVSRHGHGVIHSAKEVKTEVDEVYGSVVDASNRITGSPSSFDGSDGPVLRTLDDLVNTRNDVNHMALQQRVVSVEQLNNLEKHNQKQQGICGTYRRIPCRARCMPKNHTPDTAYFEIPLDAKHGMLLSCSMKSCRDQLGGPRFRYCQGMWYQNDDRLRCLCFTKSTLADPISSFHLSLHRFSFSV